MALLISHIGIPFKGGHDIRLSFPQIDQLSVEFYLFLLKRNLIYNQFCYNICHNHTIIRNLCYKTIPFMNICAFKIYISIR